MIIITNYSVGVVCLQLTRPSQLVTCRSTRWRNWTDLPLELSVDRVIRVYPAWLIFTSTPTRNHKIPVNNAVHLSTVTAWC